MGLQTLNVCCNRIYKAIPLAFDESLSYLEMLGAITKELNETIIQVNANTEWINNYSGDLTDIENRLTSVEENITTITSNINTINDEISDLRNATIQMINDLRSELINLINGNFNTLKNYVDNNVDNLQYQIDNINVGATLVYNATTGQIDTIQNVLNDLYELTNKDGITAGEFDLLELTASDFDSKDITAYEFDSQGKVLLQS